MKTILLSAALALSATATQANDLFKIDTELKMNGKVVSSTSAQMLARTFSQVENTQSQAYVESVTMKGDEVIDLVQNRVKTGYGFFSSAYATGEEKIQLSYTMDYTRLLSMRRKPIEGTAAFIEIPETESIINAGYAVLTRGEPFKIRGGSKHGQWELMVTATKI
ncbi:hypothetical protein [Pseudomonas putida]|uniref:hypothetical protein n=1 Tax=Pseudomonas putida TaxID=303 RepID=UPI003803A8AA